jgi:hypothetical protein
MVQRSWAWDFGKRASPIIPIKIILIGDLPNQEALSVEPLNFEPKTFYSS